MANPQTENGHTRIANEIIEKVIGTQFPATHLKIILMCWRYTYGFSRKEAKLSETYISKATGISKRYVSSAMKDLIDTKVLIVVKEPGYTSPRIIKFNKDYDQWECRTTVQQVNYSSTDELQFNTTDELQFNTTDELQFNQERKNKNNIKTKGDTRKTRGEFEIFYSLYPRSEEKRRTLTNWNTALKSCTAEDLLQAAKNYAESVKGREKQFIKTSSNFLGREKPYLDYIRVPQSSEPLKRREIIVEEIERE